MKKALPYVGVRVRLKNLALLKKRDNHDKRESREGWQTEGR